MQIPGAAYGWRARIGFLRPGMANPNHPHEFYLIVPEGVTISIASLHSFDDPADEFLSATSMSRPVSRIPDGVKLLAKQGVNAIVQAGIPHITVQGWGFEEKLRSQIREITDIPFVMDTQASIEAMKALGMSRVLMVSPFTERSKCARQQICRPRRNRDRERTPRVGGGIRRPLRNYARVGVPGGQEGVQQGRGR